MDIVGQDVSVSNQAEEDYDAGNVMISLNGKLEQPDQTEEIKSFHVKVKECNNGTSGISFTEKHVSEIEKLPSGRIRITLK